MLLNFIAKIWNGLGSPLRRTVAWLVSAKFTHGISAIILDGEGRVLLLKHRFWKQQRWGLPGGHALYGETLGETLRRELREETGLEVRPTKLVRVRIGQDRAAQFILLADCSGKLEVRSGEIIDARFWERTSLPENLLPTHRELIERGEWPGLPLEE